MAEPIRAVKGMNDILPPDSARWEWLEDKIRALMHRYGYANVRTPIVEPTALFVRGLGEVTDIVEKEMYSFVDSMNGDRLSLRPENTAGVVRAMTEHSFLREGGRRASQVFDTQSQAIQSGRQMARQGQGELLIHGQDGRIRARDSYGNDPCPPKDSK